VDYNERNGISGWNVFNPHTVGSHSDDGRQGAYSLCVQTIAGCNDTQADFYSHFADLYTEPHYVLGCKECHGVSSRETDVPTPPSIIRVGISLHQRLIKVRDPETAWSAASKLARIATTSLTRES